MGVYAFAGRGSALARAAFRSVLLGGGGLAAILLTAGAAHAGTGVTATYTGPAAPVTGDTLSWDVAGATQLSCELDLAGAATPVVALSGCGPAFSSPAAAAGTYTLRVWGANPQAVKSTDPPDVTSSVAVAPATPQPTAPKSPSNNRSPQWMLGLPAGSTGACTVTNAAGDVVASADPCASPWTSALGDTAPSGDYVLHVTASAAGFTSAAGTATYTLDVDPPSAVTVTPPSPARDTNRTPTFAVSEPDTDVSYTCTVSGADATAPVKGCGSSTTSLDLTNLADGTYTLTVKVSDAAGNAVSARADYVLDTTPPPAPTVSAPPALTNATSVTLTIGDTDPTATITCTFVAPDGTKILDKAGCPAGGVFDTSNYGDGTYQVVVSAADDLGNAATTTVSWKRDTTPPTQVTVAAPAKSTDNDRAPTFTVGEPDTGVSYVCTVTGPSDVTATSCGPSTVLDLSQAKDGTYRLTVVVKDAAGNATSAYADYTLDTTPPTAPQIQAPKSPSNDRTPTFTVVEPDQGVTFSCTVTGPSTVPTPSPCGLATSLDLSQAKDGDYTLTVTAADAVGNTSSVSVTYRLDTTPPAAPVLGTVPAATKQTVVTVSISDPDSDALLSCTLVAPGGKTVASGACPADGDFDTTGFLDGTYVLTVTAADAAGNTATTSVSWLRDTVPPPAPVVAGPPADTNLTKPTVSVSDGEATAALTCSLVVPGGSAVDLAGCPTTIDTTKYGDGLYKLVVTATDEVGNASSTTVSWTRDTVPRRRPP